MRAVISIGHVDTDSLVFIHKLIDEAMNQKLNVSVALHVTDKDYRPTPNNSPAFRPNKAGRLSNVE